MAALSDEELLEQWRTEIDLASRDQILAQMTERDLFPSAEEARWEESSGTYPDITDPEFLQKLLRKQEFAEQKQLSVVEMRAEGIDPCSREFELNATQRFIGQFMSPKTPYNSALLFHGVGVGKTCSAITVAENFLEQFPKKQVIVIAPRNIQPNFSREIFNMGERKFVMGSDDSKPNEFKGCTGSTYLKLAGVEYSRDPKEVENKITALKGRRYQLVGYFSFYKYLEDLIEKSVSKRLTGERRAQEEAKVLSRKFSGRLIIIDEAHNLRDIVEDDAENEDAPGGAKELNETQAGKKLTPYLKKILQYAEGVKLLLLTATPMYNSYKEILFLLNLLLINDKKATLSEADIFMPDGSFTDGGQELLGRVAQCYVSFMRGENPLAFPIRLTPQHVDSIEEWPEVDPQGREIEVEQQMQMIKLPFVGCEFTEEGLAAYRTIIGELLVKSGLRLIALANMIQAGNFLFPAAGAVPPKQRISDQGFKGAFIEVVRAKGAAREKSDIGRSYKVRPGVPANWMHEDQIGAYSPKTAFLLKRLKTTQGISFIYSRFVPAGALSIALSLEANGYTLEGRPSGFLRGYTLPPGGRQCAACPNKEEAHPEDHEFIPAKYILLTGRDDLTPSNKKNIESARNLSNKYGHDVKVIVGSQVASEGIDLQFVREVLVFDSWYHFNKLEQVIGRGIRNCSHAALPEDERNCTVSLLVTCFPAGQKQETVDLYQYRQGFEKAYQIGMVTRTMKQYALDCNLNRDAVLISGLDPMTVKDSQRELRSVDINDAPFTSVCDWIETCDYTCKPPIEVSLEDTDTSTYDEFSARWRESVLKTILRRMFAEQSFYRFEDMQDYLQRIKIKFPRIALSILLQSVVNNRSFRLDVKGQQGFLIYKNGFYMFQPDAMRDKAIPMALRVGLFPVKRDSYEPMEIKAAPLPAPRGPAGPAARAALPGPGPGPERPEPGPVAEEAAPAAQLLGDVGAFWKVVEGFAESIQEDRLPAARSDKKILPDAMETALQNRYESSKKSYDRAYNSLSMIVRFYQDIKANEDWRLIFAGVVRKFIWDALLSNDEQYKLFRDKQADATPEDAMVWEENLVSSGRTFAFRRVNPSTGEMEYMCDGAKCAPNLVKLFEEEETDELLVLRANAKNTGDPYGTLNYKEGIFVFKTNQPPSHNPAFDAIQASATEKLKKKRESKEKHDRGSECANVSNMKPHYELLTRLGEIAADTLGSNLGLTLREMAEVPAPRSFKNSVRACALTELCMRFFDELHVQEKRWFYRPVSTVLSGHLGRKTKKAA